MLDNNDIDLSDLVDAQDAPADDITLPSDDKIEDNKTDPADTMVNADDTLDKVLNDTDPTAGTVDKSWAQDWDQESSDAILNDLMNELDYSKDSLSNIENKWGDVTEVWLLRESLKKMEDQIKKLNNDKTDLSLKNAELEIFGNDKTDPKVLIISKHLEAAKEGDDRSKQKVSTLLKELLYDLTGSNFDQDNINSDIDTLSASEAYNNKLNPKLNDNKTDEFEGLSI